MSNFHNEHVMQWWRHRVKNFEKYRHEWKFSE
ncbi:hypothetical protein [Enterobacter phage N5822]|nr:hypothetical protein [Enterobacter phage N5822]